MKNCAISPKVTFSAVMSVQDMKNDQRADGEHVSILHYYICVEFREHL